MLGGVALRSVRIRHGLGNGHRMATVRTEFRGRGQLAPAIETSARESEAALLTELRVSAAGVATAWAFHADPVGCAIRSAYTLGIKFVCRSCAACKAAERSDAGCKPAATQCSASVVSH